MRKKSDCSLIVNSVFSHDFTTKWREKKLLSQWEIDDQIPLFQFILLYVILE